MAAVLWFYESFGENAWWISWAIVVGFQMILFFVAPIWIMPLFNKFTPLEPGELKSEIEKYAVSQDFKISGIYTMDGSRRSSKANAFFTGFGSLKRVVLFDTLISQLTVQELVAVLAHEIGHYKKKHIYRHLILAIASMGLLFFLLSVSVGNNFLFQAFGVEQTSIYASFLFFSIFYSPVSGALGLWGLALSRKYEFEADDFAKETYGRGDVLAHGLKKMSVENLSNLTPHPLKVFLSYTHPPVLERVRRLT
jgi:STE24 endopeptidase